jgi:hypothetical protein
MKHIVPAADNYITCWWKIKMLVLCPSFVDIALSPAYMTACCQYTGLDTKAKILQLPSLS